MQEVARQVSEQIGSHKSKAEYEKQFGALNPMKANNGTRWSWVDDPWPWDLNADQEKGGVSDVDL